MTRHTKLERRHFELIAATLKSTKPFNRTDVGINQWQATVDAFCAACRSSNGRFDKDRFLRACGMEA